MELVRQEDDFGCGIACFASLLGITYQEALSFFKNGKTRAENEGFYCKEIAEVLSSDGRIYKNKYIKSQLKIKIYIPGAIVFLRRSKKYPFGHYLLRTEKGWMDPWINFLEKPVKAGVRKRLPEKPIYIIFGNQKLNART